MNMRLLLSFLFVSYALIGQEKPALYKTYQSSEIELANDSDKALEAGKVYTVRLRTSPKGKGAKNEVSGAGYHLFPEERNVAWIHFTAIKSSKFALVIIPDSIGDDYDFLLFKDEGDQCLRNIAGKRQKPLRSNCSRSQNQGGGKTGLSYLAGLSENVGEGPGKAYSGSIEVTKGEQYYLVINNVYDGGAGALIRFDYFDTKVISGTVTDEEKKPVAAEVTWEDRETGDTLAHTISDPGTGEFTFEVPYRMNSRLGYSLVVTNEGSAFEEKHYTAVEISTCSPEPIAMVLTELKKGKRMRLGSINFQPDMAIFLDGAYPTLRRLNRLMKKNPHMKIHIEGHTNGCDAKTKVLSDDRAYVVKEYLMDKGVASERMTTVGLECQFMLYPLSAPESLQAKNRRVEVLVTDF